jgi:hypothetical protein
MVHFLFRFVPNPKFYWSHILRIKIKTPLHLNRLKVGRPALTDSHFKDEFTISDTLGPFSDEVDDSVSSAKRRGLAFRECASQPKAHNLSGVRERITSHTANGLLRQA